MYLVTLGAPLTGAERGSRAKSQIILDPYCIRVRATEHAPRVPCQILETRHGLADIVERRGWVLAEQLCVIPATLRARETPSASA